MEIDRMPVNRILEKWGNRKDFLIEILQDIQEEYNYLPREVLGDAAKMLDIPLNQIFEAATYYKAFSLAPKGRFQINICQGTACHIQGSSTLLKAFERELDIKTGETDGDLTFTLDVVRCIGCCGLAPVLTINQDVHAKLDPSRVPKIIESYKKRPREKS